jgi:hypothetical protein
MSKTQWSDCGKYLETLLTEYQEVVSLASANLTKIITTFKFILSHADFCISLSSESPDNRLLLEGYEVWRLATDIITRATGTRDLMQDVQKETQGGLIRVKEMREAFAGSRTSSPGDLEPLAREVDEVSQVLGQIRVHTEDLLPAVAEILAQARVLQERVEDLAARPDCADYPVYRDKAEPQNFPWFSRPEPGRENNLYQLIFPPPRKIREN